MKLLLDEMYSPQIARQLRGAGHDVVSVKEFPELVRANDPELLAFATSQGRALVTNNAVDFVPLVRMLAAAGVDHATILLTSDRSMPRSRATIGAYVEVLDELLRHGAGSERNEVHWLS